MRKKAYLTNAHEHLADTPYQLFMGLGFDQRCLTFIQASLSCLPRHVVAITNVGWGFANAENKKKFEQLTHENNLSHEFVTNESGGILHLADALATRIDSASNDALLHVIDVTSMSHELLAVLVAILHHKKLLYKCLLVYNGAESYSTNTTRQNMWLSRGVSEVRSILGYPGIQLSSTKLHLTLLTGFEVDRALEAVSKHEPSTISVGVGALSESVSADLHELNVAHREQLLSALLSKGFSAENVSQFEFSCTDPLLTKKNLKDHLANFVDYNNVICPLNTKLSTVGAALHCLDDAYAQLCYVQPIEYNFQGYAKPSNEITFFSFD